jgi:hypothetical protein
VSARIEQQTSRVFVTRSGIVETWSGDGRRTHWLQRRPVVSLDSLVVDTQTLVPTTNYYVDLASGRLDLTGGVFGFGVANCVVSYSAGWGAQDSVALPGDVYQAGLDYVKAVYDERVSGAIAASSVSLGPTAMLIKPGLPYGIKSVIDSWREVRA